jgi:dTDP-4-dehydrorhamnose 3,5-epimerase
MIFQETRLSGAFIVDLEKIEDERGFFAEAWKGKAAEQHGISVTFNRSNISFNRNTGTIRGLHAQQEPFAEAKLIHCIQGKVFDVIVDIRPESPTYCQWFSVELSAENHRMLYVPRGFLHGFETLVENSTVFYEVAGEYTPHAEIGARYDDPAFAINWPRVAAEPTLSDKDARWPLFPVTNPKPCRV